jgi:hypothetical protein
MLPQHCTLKGRNAVRRMQGKLNTEDNRLQNLTDIHVFFSIFDQLPIWDLLSASRVCVRLNFVWERYRERRWGKNVSFSPCIRLHTYIWTYDIIFVYLYVLYIYVYNVYSKRREQDLGLFISFPFLTLFF